MERPGTRLYSLKIEPITREVYLNCKANNIETPVETSSFKETVSDEDLQQKSDDYIVEATAGSKAKRKKKRYHCTLCDKYLHNIDEHRRMHANQRTQQCPYCEKAFVYRSNLYTHLNIHTQERIYRCEQCGSEFSSIQGLKQHRTIHFARQYACTVCKRMYSRKCYLRIHQQRMHMPKEQKHKCLICDREFQNETQMEKHMTIHQDSTLFECNACHRVYNAKRNLARHIRTAHRPQASAEG
ncbi:zinc finger protein 184-like [Anopheles maculipalpis]|uniref:zinc finger protein 184-like n=1 Tax=Anopheles maculipalpis TaxID=1496333 RepID=UPI0021599925|nr:zinc finger protein 184-like [Anopheles maculipalpis]